MTILTGDGAKNPGIFELQRGNLSSCFSAKVEISRILPTPDLHLPVHLRLVFVVNRRSCSWAIAI